jgi:all-trans-retinol 13,14-reductase
LIFVAWIFGGLSALSIASMLARRPWTMRIARRHTSPEVWETALFLETNLVITAGWALLFAGAAALTATAPLWLNVAYGGLLVLLGRLSPRFGSWYSSRRLRATGLIDPE